MDIRNEIERVIKDKNIDRSKCFECSKIAYSSIIKKIEQVFVLHGGDIHWSNMGAVLTKNWYVKQKIYRKIECGLQNYPI